MKVNKVESKVKRCKHFVFAVCLILTSKDHKQRSNIYIKKIKGIIMLINILFAKKLLARIIISEFKPLERQIEEGEMLLQKLYLEDEGMKSQKLHLFL